MKKIFSKGTRTKRIAAGAIALFLLIASGCAISQREATAGIGVTDVFGSTSYLQKDARVVAAYPSFAECWLLAGGTLTGVATDSGSRDVSYGERVETVGTVKEINLETVLSLQPDYVILSADLAAHLALQENLSAAGIEHGFFRVDTFEDYAALLRQFCNVTGREDLYRKNVEEPGARIEEIRSKFPKDCDKTVLLMRAFSSGIKAKTDDNLAGMILKEMGLVNIADQSPSLLEEMSLEHIIACDPDYIFVLTMGSEESAKAFLKENMENNPAFAALSAVQQGRYAVLPKELFHYKPNNRWDESYEYLAKIVYPEISF